MALHPRSISLNRPTSARVGFAILGTLALVGCVLSLRNGLISDSTIPDGAGWTRIFPRGWQHTANQLAFFTFLSNALVAATSLILAVRGGLRSTLGQVVHLCGLICIVITGVVFNVLLRNDDPMTPLQTFHDSVQHIATPILAPVLFLVFGPLGLVTWRRIGQAAIIPLVWLGVTLARGALWDWYPYTILDVPKLGYAGIAPYVVAIFASFFVIGGLLWLVDRRRSADATR